MCINRYWKNLYPTGIKDNTFSILARRSDGLDFSVTLSLTPIDNISEAILLVVRNAILEIEAFRTCSCSNESKCQKHIKEKQ